MSDDELVGCALEDGVAWLTLRDPKRRNAISEAMGAELAVACERIDADATIGAAVLRGAGGYFCSGGDLRLLATASADPTSDEGMTALSTIYAGFVRFLELAVPTVALVEGGAVGAGMNLAAAADVLVVTEDAVLDSGFLTRAVHPGGGHLALMHRFLSVQDTMAFSVLGAPLTGMQAAARGLAWAAVPQAAIVETVRRLVRGAGADPDLARLTKRSARRELGPPGVDLATALELERAPQMWSLARKGAEGWGPRR
ncbi:enoyl-CoA hydratase-related protein [Nocardioides halotolerans]|uniref:enoyl-CoA hydratase-related protein n=1 Tax=Nocardioides halotolerans TaxID=433660 RepID=UPI000421E6BB|nr:enoyl-CoA hydratase-related protein [Nocardioides halotolerans]